MRFITIKDIAKEAGVSTATVSYVINGSKPVKPDKRQRVLNVIAKTDYQPDNVAKSLRTKKTNIIGVLVEDIMSFPASRVINGISQYTEQTDYHILLNDLRMLDSLHNRYDQIIHQKDKINKALSLLVFGAKVDAVIYVGMFDRDISGIISDVKKPVVIAYSTSKDEHICSVTYENESISEELAKHLFAEGHRRIAIITGLKHTAPALKRMNGIKKAFKDAGIALDDALVKHGDWERESAYSCMMDILKQGRDSLPTALLAMNDTMAIAAMDAIREMKLRVPEDISVVGFDNREVSEHVFPKLTTVQIDLEAIGFMAAKLIDHKLSGDGEYADTRDFVVPSRLILRDTVARVVES